MWNLFRDSLIRLPINSFADCTIKISDVHTFCRVDKNLSAAKIFLSFELRALSFEENFFFTLKLKAYSLKLKTGGEFVDGKCFRHSH